MVLGWNEVEGATGYDLFVYARVSGWKWLGGTSRTSTSYTHTGLTSRVTYWYTVRAMNDDEASPLSSQVSVTIPAQAQ